MSGLEFTLSTVTSFLPDNPSGLKKGHIQACLVIFRSKLELHPMNLLFEVLYFTNFAIHFFNKKNVFKSNEAE